MSEQRAHVNRIARALAFAIASVLIAAGVVLPAESASAVTYVACGDIDGVSGLVSSIDRGNRTLGGTATVYLYPGCTYSMTEPAWDYDDYGNKIYEDSAFYELNDGLGYHTTLIVEGNGATIQRSSSAGSLFRLFDIGHQGTVILRNLTLANSYGPHGSGPDRDGSSAANGGAIYNEGNLTLDGVTFTGNHPGNGENGDNTAGSNGYIGGSGGSGGAIANRGTLTISGSTFRNNKTGDGGAGGSAAWNGGQGGSSGDGGAIWNTGTLTITTSTFDGNYTGSAGSGGSGGFGSPPSYRGNGGAIASTGGSVTISRSLFLSNSTGGFAGEGGALAISNGAGLSVLTTSFVNNVANRAGAIYMSSGAATVRQSTFTGNNANGTGNRISGDVAAMDYGATMTFANTLMDDNDPSQVDCNTQYIGSAVSYTSLGGVISDENTGCGTNTVVADPKLEALGSWGGPTQSRALKSDSPAIGSGTAAYCGGVDQRGVPRPASGCDVGAVERLAALTAGVINGPLLVTEGVPRTYSTNTTVDGATLAYLWSVTGATATISSATAAAPQITFTDTGAAVVHLNVRVVGSSDAESIDLAPITVKVPPADNDAPTLTWTGSAVTAANEGDTTRFNFTMADPEGDAITFSSGYPSCGTGGSLSESQLLATSGYIDCFFPNGPTSPVVTARVEDFWTAATSLSTTVSVAEVAPTITVTGSATANEGATATYSYSIHEVGSDTFTPVTTCPGGTKVSGSDTYTSALHDSSGTFQCKFGNGPSTTTATVTANGGTGSKTVSVVNVAPTIAVSGPTPTAENGATVTTYRYDLNAVDPGDKANLVVVAGTASCGGSGGVVVGYDATAVVCRFANGPSSALVTATVRDQDGATSSGGGLTVSVTNTAPTVTVGQPTGSVNEGSTVYYSLSATDPGLDTLTVTAPSGCTANFVDNTTPGHLTGVIACTYTDGPAVVSKIISVNDGTSSGTATIANQPVVDVEPTIAMNFTGWDGWEGGSVTLHVGAITDPGVDTATSVIVHWGDGTSVTLGWPLASTELTHAYSNEGEYFATIDIIDGDGTHLDRGGSQRMVVHNSPPTVFLTAPAGALEGVTTPVTFSVSVGSSETFTIDDVNCGRDDFYVVIPVTDLVVDADGGSFNCEWPIGERDQQITLGVRDSGGSWSGAVANVRVSNAPPVVSWTSGSAVAYESLTDVHRFDFIASDNGVLGMILQTYSIFGGLTPLNGCGQGGTIVSQVDNHYGGTQAGVVFDPDTGIGYVDCTFTEGPAIAHVQIAIGDWQSQTIIGMDVTVLNSVPTVTLTAPADSVAEGQPAVFSYETSDAVGEAVSITDIDCGDHGTLDSQDVGTFSCIYDDGPADYTASITVSDGDDTGTDGALVHVVDAPPTSMTLTGSNFYEPGDPYELTLGDTNDVGDDTVQSWTIYWGDGSTSTVSSATPNPTHTYTDHDSHTITVDVTDEDGEYLALATKELSEFDHVPPVLTLPGDVTMEGNAADGLYWIWPRSAVDERDGELGVYCTGMQYYDVYDFFFAGSTAEYDCWAEDAAGNRSEGSFSVTTVDTTAPRFAEVTLGDVNATSAAGAVVSWPTSASDVVDYFPIAGTCDQVSGALYAFGTYSVHCEATDRAGNTGIRDFTFRVGDYGGPAISATGLVQVEATGPDGAIATYTLPTATDSLDGAVPVSCSPASGSLFPLDYTTVTCSATDSSSHTSTSTFLVRVHDLTPPVITPTDDILVGPTSLDGAIVTFDTPGVSDVVDADLTVTCYPASGAQFPIGVTTVQCAAQDDWGNWGSDLFDVTVQDTGAPHVIAPDDIVLEATGPGGAVVTYSGETSFDVVDGTVAVTCDTISGSTFPVGVTTVTCSATDSESLTGSATFTVSVTDTTAPTVAVPSNVTAEATGPSTSVTYTPAAATDLVDGTVATSCLPASGATLGLGYTTVTCSATDAHGNTGSATFTIRIVDTTPPTITAPDITVGATSSSGATVNFAPPTVDLVDGTLVAACTPLTGTVFAAESTTTVNCQATDGQGNTGTASFSVTVHGAVISADADAGDTEVEVSLAIFAPGDYVVIDEGGPNEEVRLVEDLGSIILAAPLAHAHGAGTMVSVIAPPPLGDTTAPTITAASLGSVSRGTVVDPEVVCTDTGVGVEACVVPALSTAALGAHTAMVRSWDFNGNLSTLALSYTVVSPAALGATGVQGIESTASKALLLVLAGAALVLFSRRRQEPEWLLAGVAPKRGRR